MKELAEDVIAIFLERGIHREARKAGLLLGRALLEEDATVKLVKSVARYLKLARRDPSYRFTPDD